MSTLKASWRWGNAVASGADTFDRHAERGRAMTEEETLRFAVHALERAQDTTKMSVAG